MIRIAGVKLPLSYTDEDILNISSKELRIDKGRIEKCSLFKRSIDARHKNDIKYVSSIDVCLNVNEQNIISKLKSNNVSILKEYKYELNGVKKLNARPVVIGFGPAGMFASLILARFGAKPIIFERGYDVNKRTSTVDNLWNNRVFSPTSNVQFGEGGAGTFSDGKLNTGTKDIRIRQVLIDFVKHGAPEDILYNAKPHIGTDKLKDIVKNIRKEIIDLGGEIHFDSKLIDIESKENEVTAVIIESNNSTQRIETNNVILAIGHSARDTFKVLKEKDIKIEPKPFAIGARIEHLREQINISQYGKDYDKKYLGAADYKLFSHLKNGRTVYTFCMCPGGKVVCASSIENTVVTNGMSEYARNDTNSNSALLVSVSPDDFKSDDVLSGMYYQEELEKKAFLYGGENYNAPVQRVEDFFNNRVSTSFGDIKPSYMPGTSFSNTNDILPSFITESIKEGIKDFSKRLRGFDNPDAILTSVESRSSSPIRILRDESLESVTLKGLYPCGEGAGYAGGIMSASVDGIKCAEKILTK